VFAAGSSRVFSNAFADPEAPALEERPREDGAAERADLVDGDFGAQLAVVACLQLHRHPVWMRAGALQGAATAAATGEAIEARRGAQHAFDQGRDQVALA
jgi:hypothetical protein